MPNDNHEMSFGCQVAEPHTHETYGEMTARNSRLAARLRGGTFLRLTPEEFDALVPPPAPSGCPQNRARGCAA